MTDYHNTNGASPEQIKLFKVKATAIKTRILKHFRQYPNTGFTTWELYELLFSRTGFKIYVIRPRVSALISAGFIYDTGEKRDGEYKGVKCRIYKLVK